MHTLRQDTLTLRYSAPRTRRSHSAQFKAKAHLEVVCERPGASVAALAREHGVNANVLHRRRKEIRQRMRPSDNETGRVDHHDIDTRATSVKPLRAQTAAVVVNRTPAFVAIDLRLPALHTSHAARPDDAVPTPAVSPTPSDIRKECRHYGRQIAVHWTIAAASECTR